MKNIYLSLISGFLFTACSLDRVPYDALSTATFPKTEADVEMLAVGCYDGYATKIILYTMTCSVITLLCHQY